MLAIGPLAACLVRSDASIAPYIPSASKFPPYYTTFSQIFSTILQFPTKPAIIQRKAREQLLNTQLFPFLRLLCAAPALRQARSAAN